MPSKTESSVPLPVSSPSRVLVVDDDPVLLRSIERALRSFGHDVVTAPSAEAALEALIPDHFDILLSDINLPRADGLNLVRQARATDAAVACVLMTGDATVASATEAVALGAFRYLIKPVDFDELERVMRSAASTARARRAAVASHTPIVEDIDALSARFDLALSRLWMAYQPIVRLSTRTIVAYEALVRSSAPGMESPANMLAAAEKLGRVRDLGRLVRRHAVLPWNEAAVVPKLFVNLHASDIGDDDLIAAGHPFSDCTDQVCLEVTERAALASVDEVRDRVRVLRDAGFQLAIDDLGAGYSGLTSLVQLEPEVVKIDMSLIRGIDQSPRQQKVVKSIVHACEGLLTVAEGVETRAELDVLVNLGCDVFQGYFFARPGSSFPTVRWPD
jgi:EAL domain-containing protein (putative c-di-GMP-specific phosphodiesterase class I)